MLQDEPSLVIRSAGTLLDERAVMFPTLKVDASDRPDVAALPEIVAREGVGDLNTVADVALLPDGRRVVRLRVSMTKPVVVSWTVALLLPAYTDLLRLAADTGCLVFAFTVAGDDGSERGWLGVDIDSDALRSVVDFGA
ncbi:MAG: hypothetical protein RLZZ269_450 [Actinomycetota bacterium]